MAIDQGTETLTIKTEERTWRTNIETPYGVSPTVTVWRELIRTSSDGTVISRENIGNTTSRVLGDIAPADQPVIHALTDTMPDLWRAEDKVKAKASADAIVAAQAAAALPNP